MLLQAMVEEVRRSAAEEEASIHALFSSMQVRGSRTLSILLSRDPVPRTQGRPPAALAELPV